MRQGLPEGVNEHEFFGAVSQSGHGHPHQRSALSAFRGRNHRGNAHASHLPPVGRGGRPALQGSIGLAPLHRFPSEGSLGPGRNTRSACSRIRRVLRPISTPRSQPPRPVIRSITHHFGEHGGMAAQLDGRAELLRRLLRGPGVHRGSRRYHRRPCVLVLRTGACRR